MHLFFFAYSGVKHLGKKVLNKRTRLRLKREKEKKNSLDLLQHGLEP